MYRPNLGHVENLDELQVKLEEELMRIYSEAQREAEDLTSRIGQLNKGENPIINGGFDIWQRASVGSTGYTADRWIGNLSGCSLEVSRQTLSPGSPDVKNGSINYMRAVVSGVTAGASGANVGQKIEGVTTFAGEEVTLSLHGHCDGGASKIGVRLIQSFGSGGSAAVETDVGVLDFAGASAWATKSLTFTVPSISGKTVGSDSYLWLVLDLTSVTRHSGSLDGQSGSFRFTNVRVDKGASARDWSAAGPALELLRCQRYFFRGGEGASGLFRTGSYIVIGVPFPTEMRASPAVSLVAGQPVTVMVDGGTTTGASPPSLYQAFAYSTGATVSIGGFTAQGQTTRDPCVVYNTPDFLDFDAEL